MQAGRCCSFNDASSHVSAYIIRASVFKYIYVYSMPLYIYMYMYSCVYNETISMQDRYELQYIPTIYIYVYIYTPRDVSRVSSSCLPHSSAFKTTGCFSISFYYTNLILRTERDCGRSKLPCIKVFSGYYSFRAYIYNWCALYESALNVVPYRDVLGNNGQFFAWNEWGTLWSVL